MGEQELVEEASDQKQTSSSSDSDCRSSSTQSASQDDAQEQVQALLPALTQSASQDDAQEQVQALLQALDLLAKLASMETDLYQNTLTRKKPASAQEKSLHASTNDASRIQQSLEQIQSQWKLEETSIPLLTRSIQRFHSNLAILQAETDQHAQETKILQQHVSELSLQKKKLEKVVTKLHTKNAKLTDMLKQKYKERKSLIKHVKDYVQKVQESKAQQQELEEITTAYKLQAHEQFLLQNRVRTTSVDSNFSDADALDFPDSDNVSIHSSCSMSSFVTDEGIATVRLTAVPNNHDSPMATLSDQSEDSLSDSYHSPTLAHPATTTKPPVYTLSFPRGTKVGLKIRCFSVDELPKPPKGILTSADLEGDEESRSKTENDSKKPKDENKRDGFSMGFHLDSLLGKPPMHSQGESDLKSSSSQRGRAFVVSGYNDDFDSQLNAKPTLGARIVAINGDSIDSSWSMPQLMDRLHSSCDAQDARTNFTVSFRNDPLSRRQRESLGKPPNHHSEHSEQGTTTMEGVSESSKMAGEQGGHRSFKFGFLKMGPGNVAPTRRPGQRAVSCDSLTPTMPHPDDLDHNGEQEPVEKTATNASEPRSGSANTNMLQFWKTGDAQSPGRKPEADLSKQDQSKEMKGGGGPGFQFPFWKPHSQSLSHIDKEGSPRSTADSPASEVAAIEGTVIDESSQESERKPLEERVSDNDKDEKRKSLNDVAECDSLAAEVLEDTAPSQSSDVVEPPVDKGEVHSSVGQTIDGQSAAEDTRETIGGVPTKPIDGGDIARNTKKAVSKFFSNPFHT